MTAPVVVEGMSREDLDAVVQELVSECEFEIAVECIEEWIAWDWHGRWEDTSTVTVAALSSASADSMERVRKSRPSVKDRLAGEFGEDLGA